MINLAVMVVDMLQSDDHVRLVGVIAHTTDETALRRVHAEERIKRDVATKFDYDSFGDGDVNSRHGGQCCRRYECR